MKTIYDLNKFARAYVQAIYFTDAGPDNEIDESVHEFSPEALDKIAADCAAFEEKAGEDIYAGCTCGSGEYSESERAAHDFWLTRNGHGAGFWDGDWPEPAASRLTALAKEFGQCDSYLGDDGSIHLS